MAGSMLPNCCYDTARMSTRAGFPTAIQCRSQCDALRHMIRASSKVRSLHPASYSMSESQYATHFIRLESDPKIFSDLLHSLGASRKVVFKEVYSLDGSVEVPYPALSLILILPTSKAYEENKAREEAIIASTEHNGGEVDEHKKSLILPGSFLAKLLDTKPEEKTRFLESSEELKQSYAAAAARGNTGPPAPDDVVDFHFLDGDRNGPIPRGTAISAQEDMLTGVSLQILRDTIKQENGESVGFSLMALTKVGNDAENECFGELSIAADCLSFASQTPAAPSNPRVASTHHVSLVPSAVINLESVRASLFLPYAVVEATHM
ncbi:hypothetical protein LEMA_P124670.1 [Plenodomus lingam JN3]|uniref:ubiquitinyl hydrolase 1 n=1 Tax=Leptosphaeria maculans (strain JN3 / isolate v23.1.3 / race Av1-4-5-6-7-8) TaxID=985895 RepID=E4ZQ28_LEPMJ|nr:hypothetical protein LEMA_P124670.1 [Plenodomus lingam JN3]CBX89938.1 hypothetical protein LEMA_P124670.1 [Plenodomus lingam JN3]